MSVLVSVKVPADTARFSEWVESSGDFLEATSATAREAGCLHHQFAVGDGFVMILDEWDSAEAFQEFFGNPDIAEAMGQAGAQGEPEITIGEAVDSADRF